MKAVAVVKPGEPAELIDLPIPEPGAGQLRIRVRAVGVNPYDGKRAGGMYGELPLPFVPGIDGAGDIDAVGPAAVGEGAVSGGAVSGGAARFAVGDRVFGRLGGAGQFGSFAEYAVVSAEGVIAHIPDGVDYDVAAALPVSGLTALGVLRELSLAPGDTLLIIGATGGVGTFLTQLAANLGVDVIATARPELAQRTLDLGARATVDHSSAIPIADQLVALGVTGLRAIVDLAGARDTVDAVVSFLPPGGKALSTTGGVDPEKLAARHITGIQYRGRSTAAMLEELAAMVARGDIVVQIDRRLALGDGPRALEESRSNHLHGKTVLRIDGETDQAGG